MLADKGKAAETIAVSVLTGFLGSGKTTLLNHLLQHPECGETAVLINEFGEVGIDHLLVAELGDDLLLLSSGCICCTVKGELIESLKGLYLKRLAGQVPEFKRVIIETTGLADPIPIITCLMKDPLFRHVYRLESLVTTIDAVYGDPQLDAHPEAVRQAAVADRLIITKTDVVDAEAVRVLRRRLVGLNPGATLIPAVFGRVSPSQLFNTALYDPETKSLEVQHWLNEEAYAGADGSADDHGHQGQGPARHADHAIDVNRHDEHITAFCLTVDRPLPWRDFLDWLDDLTSQKADHLLRIKGLVNIEGEHNPFVLQCVQATRHPLIRLPAWPDDDRRSRIVFITYDLPREIVDARLAAFLNDLARSAGSGKAAKAPAGAPTSESRPMSRERWLNEAEITRIFAALAKHGTNPAANAIRLTFLTGARWSEVLEARWPEFDLDRGVWSMPRQKGPRNRPHRIRLSQPALLLLRELASRDTSNEPVFADCRSAKRGGDVQSLWNAVTKLVGVADAKLEHLRPSFTGRLFADQDPAVQRRLLGISKTPNRKRRRELRHQ